jgi:hypothetical protein
MAALTAETNTMKGLLLGNSGTGKTGSLYSLAARGYNLRVLDMDNGTEILYQLSEGHPEVRARIDVEKHADKYTEQAGALRPALPLTGFSGAAKVLTNWPGLGKPTTWGTQDIIVVDSLTRLGQFIMNHVLSGVNKLVSGQQPSQPDWGAGISLQENILAGLFSLPCHVLVIAHVVNITPEGATTSEGFPSALGNKLPQKVGSYFNTTLGYKHVGVGQNKVRKILTKDPTLGCKVSAPGKLKDEYPLETGLGEIFDALYGPLKSA